MKGPPSPNNNGHYGSITIADTANNPPSRTESTSSWVDTAGNFWLFGGHAKNDLWQYKVDINQWIWMKGSSGTFQPGVYGSLGVPDPQNAPGSRWVYSRWIDDLGNLILFGGHEDGLGEFNDVWRYNIPSNQWTWIGGFNMTNGSTFCYGQCNASTYNLPCGRMENKACWKGHCGLMYNYGGEKWCSTIACLLGDLWSFNVNTGEWTFISGSLSTNPLAVYGTKYYPAQANTPGGRAGPCSWSDSLGNLWMFGGIVSAYSAFTNDLWKYVPDPDCPSNPGLGNISVTHDTTICRGDSIQLSASGGIHYQWFPSSHINNIHISHPVVFPLINTTYSVTITNDTCSTTRYVHIQVLIDTQMKITTPDTMICAGQTVQLTATGGSQYLWNTNDTTSTIIVQPTVSGIYYVTMTDTLGCKAKDSLFVSLKPVPVLQLTPSQASICIGDSISLLVSGAQNYHWIPAVWLSSSTGDSVTATPQNSILYHVIGTDANGCTGNDSILVTVHPLPVIILPNDTSICRGDSIVLHVSGALNYHWNPPAYLSSVTGNSVTAGPQQNITYTVTGIDQYSCRDTSQITIIVHIFNDSISKLITPDTAICKGQTIQLIAQGGNQYLWSTQETASSIQVQPSSQSTYSVTITDNFGCHAKDSVKVYVLSKPVITARGDTAICSGEPVTLTANGATYYDWYPTAGLSANTGNLVIANPQQTITYTVTGTDQNGCSDTAKIKIDVIDCQVTIPNVFTPNGDGKNDYFKVLYDGSLPFNILIFNRWGIKLFESKNLDAPWDGKYKGNDVPGGTYYYLVTIGDRHYSGVVTLIR